MSLSLNKATEQVVMSLNKRGITNIPKDINVSLLLDYSYSMDRHYNSGAVSRVLQRLLSISNVIDDVAKQQDTLYYTYPITKLQWSSGGRPVDAINFAKAVSGVSDDNKIKPSISECTRALLRRVPREVYVSSRTDPDLELILTLCKKENVRVMETDHIAPYKAIAVLI